MKRFRVFFCFCWMLGIAYGQHLTFNGVPIDGTLEMFVDKLEQKGVQYVATMSGIALMQGDLAGYKGCLVSASTYGGNDLVFKVAVAFPACDAWMPLQRIYIDLKGQLILKYGEPSQVIEQLDVSYTKNDYTKFKAIKSDHCRYATIFLLPEGLIVLSVEYLDLWGECVMIEYYDAINGKKLEYNYMNDL